MPQKKESRAVEINPTYIGYARVSTEDQNLQMQEDALLAAGVGLDHIYVEKKSARAKKRPVLDAALLDCNPDDTLVVWRLDRFGRDVLDVLRRLETMEAAGIKFLSLNEKFDTSSPMGRAFLGMVAVFAQFESDVTKARTKAGVTSAKKRGVQFGRKAKVGPEKYDMLLAMVDDSRSSTEIARRFKISRQTVYETIKKARAAQRRKD